MKKKLMTVLGTRPEITKMADLIPLLDQDFDHTLIHTKQHFDFNMDQVFFKELELRQPDLFLDANEQSNSAQVGQILLKLEPVVKELQPDAIVAYADTNSMLGGALTAVKNRIPLIHLEAGCRTFDRQMPEEINRVIADSVASLLFASDQMSINNLRKEGITSGLVGKTYRKVVLSGRTIYPVLKAQIKKSDESILKKLNLKPKQFLLTTFHRAANTDDVKTLKSLVNALNQVSEKIKIVFPIHPRTLQALAREQLSLAPNISAIEPLGYLPFLTLIKNSNFVVSDSGGIQEEAAILNVPCLILRNETEWEELVEAGKNKIITNNVNKIVPQVWELLNDSAKLERMRTSSYPWIENPTQIIISKIKRYLEYYV